MTCNRSAVAHEVHPAGARNVDGIAEASFLHHPCGMKVALAALAATVLLASTARAQDVVTSGYVETYWAWDFARPSNGVINGRTGDRVHDGFAIGNAAIGARFEDDAIRASIVLQSGSLPRGEATTSDATPAGSQGGSGWGPLQQASVGWRAPIGAGLLLEAGIFLAPFGPDGYAVHERWSWSMSNLAFALPVRVAGARASYPISERVTATAMVLNGWSGAVDDNVEKSVLGEIAYEVVDAIALHARYLGGVERARDAPEGRPWRHVLDVWTAVQATSALSFRLHGDGGFERTDFGTSGWLGGAIDARVRAAEPLFFVVRVDGYRQWTASDARGTADVILFAAQGVISGTATIDVRPHPSLSLRAEYRHDQSMTPLYFRGEVLGSGSAINPWEPNTHGQDTVLIGGTAWF